MDSESAAAVEKLLAAFNAVSGGGNVSPQKLSPRQKAGMIILARAIIHQQNSLHVSLLGMSMIELVGRSEWPGQPIKSSTELLYRGAN